MTLPLHGLPAFNKPQSGAVEWKSSGQVGVGGRGQTLNGKSWLLKAVLTQNFLLFSTLTTP
ncbi:MAG: hypothetical protein H7Z11_17520 [Verrucomicrobia bacterium]|nr:hypothetical protein [Leptolyngbya sp. ES-bin-22]